MSLYDLLLNSNYTVILTGAGMSTESGIPDFRSLNNGLWQTYNPQELASTKALYDHRYDFIKFYQMRMNLLKNCSPHKAYFILSKWEQEGIIQSIITQNVDGFHRQAGSVNVAELHGTISSVHCQECGKAYSNDKYLRNDFSCDYCHGFLRPSVVLFGEGLPEDAIQRAEYETKQADLFIVLGSSLQVSPANYFPVLAKRNGAKLVIVNMEPTELDGLADYTIQNKKIGDILNHVNEHILPK